MLTKTEAIVLRNLKYGDSRIIVDMFTREHGRLSFAVPMPKSPRGRLKKQLFQPLTLLSVVCDVRPRQELQRLADAVLLEPLPMVHGDARKLSIGLFLAEFLCHALKGEQQNVPLFEYLKGSVMWLEGCTGSFSNFHLVFLMRMSRFLGFYPNVEEQGARGKGQGPFLQYFDLRAASFCTNVPLHTDYLQPREAAVIATFMRMDYATMHLFRMSHDERNRAVDIMLTYYRLHLPSFPELRSLDVLKAIWA